MSSPANAGDMSSIPIWEDPICLGAMKPQRHSYRACALEPEILCSTARTLCTGTKRSRHSLQLEESLRSNQYPARKRIKGKVHRLWIQTLSLPTSQLGDLVQMTLPLCASA